MINFPNSLLHTRFLELKSEPHGTSEVQESRDVIFPVHGPCWFDFLRNLLTCPWTTTNFILKVEKCCNSSTWLEKHFKYEGPFQEPRTHWIAFNDLPQVKTQPRIPRITKGELFDQVIYIQIVRIPIGTSEHIIYLDIFFCKSKWSECKYIKTMYSMICSIH